MTHAHDHDHEVEPIEGSWAPRAAPDVATVEVDGELLLLDPRTDGVHQLDRLGSLIWQVLDGDATVDELVDDLADVFGAPVEQVGHDVVDLLIALRGLGLLEGTDPPAWSIVGAEGAPTEADDADNADLWRPSYLVDPPAP